MMHFSPLKNWVVCLLACLSPLSCVAIEPSLTDTTAGDQLHPGNPGPHCCPRGSRAPCPGGVLRPSGRAPAQGAHRKWFAFSSPTPWCPWRSSLVSPWQPSQPCCTRKITSTCFRYRETCGREPYPQEGPLADSCPHHRPEARRIPDSGPLVQILRHMAQRRVGRETCHWVGPCIILDGFCSW